jgi:hypothetical protein
MRVISGGSSWSVVGAAQHERGAAIPGGGYLGVPYGKTLQKVARLGQQLQAPTTLEFAAWSSNWCTRATLLGAAKWASSATDCYG